MWRDGNAKRGRALLVVAAVLLLTSTVAVDDVVGVSTNYTLLGVNTIEVTESRMTCKNGQSVSVTTGAKGNLYVLSPTRTSFEGVKWQRRMAELDREPDDEQGHVVASSFGGPIKTWNLVPQHRSINRKINVQSNLLNRWHEFETWARHQVGNKSSPVEFIIKINYASGYGCRPVSFEVNATSMADPGFRAEFDNRTNGTFGIVAATTTGNPRKKQKTKH